MMSESLLQKLEWGLLQSRLAENCQTPDGRDRCLNLQPDLTREEILRRWQEVRPVTDLYRQGYRAPVGELDPVGPLLKAASLGQILEGSQLRSVYRLLVAVKTCHGFAQDFSAKCETLNRFRNRLVLLSGLYRSIEKAVDEDGAILDQASPELNRIRKQQRGLRQKIEQKLRQVLNSSQWDLYLQDDFFTKRSERYVIPVRLDGRGRVPGSIVDTSESGQTLFIEPASVAPLNQTLQDLELSEKLEIIRILKELSQQVASEGESVQDNYNALIYLDELSAEAQLACDLDAIPVELSEEPAIDLRGARHPMVRTPGGGDPVPNHISLDGKHRVLIISGPNAGGKTVVLKTLGTLVLMAKAGLQVPADPGSRLFLFEKIFIEMGDAQSLTASLSTFSGHIQGLKPVVESVGAADLVLLDELAVGTEPETGAAIAQAILEVLADKNCRAVVTTHYDNLKTLAVKNEGFRNASMEYSLSSFKPTYRLILDVPGQSYGLELAAQIGMPVSLIDRARELRGVSVSALDDAVGQLMEAREKARLAEEEMRKAQKEAEAGKARWDHDVQLLEQSRKKAIEALRLKYEKELTRFRSEHEAWAAETKKLRKDIQKGHFGSAGELAEAMNQQKQRSAKSVKNLEKARSDLEGQGEVSKKPANLPGRIVDFETYAPGDQIYIIPLQRPGRLIRKGSGAHEKFDVEAGSLKLKVDFKDLRFVGREAGKPAPRKKVPRNTGRKKTEAGSGYDDSVVVQTSTNTLDLRGLEVAEALEKTWRFIDAAVLRGEPSLFLVHGHGTDTLKTEIRKALRDDSPYGISHRAGSRSQGGDGVTVVIFDR